MPLLRMHGLFVSALWSGLPCVLAFAAVLSVAFFRRFMGTAYSIRLSGARAQCVCSGVTVLFLRAGVGAVLVALR